VSREQTLRTPDFRRDASAHYREEPGKYRGRRLNGCAEVGWIGERLAVRTPPEHGAFAASLPVTLFSHETFCELSVEIDFDCDSGTLGFGLLNETSDTWLRLCDAQPGRRQTAALQATTTGEPVHLVFRNASKDGVPALGSIHNIRIGVNGRRRSSALDWAALTVHGGQADLLDDGSNPYAREARFACKAVYHNLYIHELFFRIAPCCFMVRVPGFEEARFGGDMTFMQAWNSPAMVELRHRLAEGPLFGPCRRCPETW
jgi:hypothetical protein